MDSWILDLLENGLSLTFKSLPPPYFEKNNKSALNNIFELRTIISEWELAGKVIKVKDRPYCCNPLSVMIQTNSETGKVKVRPCIDMSRCVNKYIKFPHISLGDLKSVQKLISPGDFMTNFDLTSMYHQIKLNPKFYKYFGFSLTNVDGELEYYVFTVMQFGLSMAVYVVTRLLKPMRNFLRSLSIKFNIYIDDGQLWAKTKILAEKKINFVIKCFELTGWVVNYGKSNLIGVQSLKYLGFIIDTVSMKLFYPSKKLDSLVLLIRETIVNAKNLKPFKCRFLAKLLGSLASMQKSHGSIINVMSRKMQHILGKSVHLRGWESDCILDDHAIQELSFLAEHLVSLNGNSIFSTRTSVKVLNSEYEADISFSPSEGYNALVSDASSTQSFIFTADEKFSLVKEFVFSPSEVKLSSGHRELLSIVKLLMSEKAFFETTPGLYYWLTDSQNAYNFLNRGSRKELIQKDVLKIKLFEKECNISIVPIWVPRTDANIVLADIGSKLDKSSDEWTIDSNSYEKIVDYFNFSPTLDCFATEANKKTQMFFSKIPQFFSSGINFFAQTLKPDYNYWICPPVTVIADAITHILNHENISGIMLVPIWKGSDFFLKLVKNQHFAEFSIDYLILSPCFYASNNHEGVFSVYKNFKCLALLFNSSAKCRVTIPRIIFDVK